MQVLTTLIVSDTFRQMVMLQKMYLADQGKDKVHLHLATHAIGFEFRSNHIL